MSDHLKATIADLQGKLREQEALVTRTKLLINQLAEMAGMDPLYDTVEPQATDRGLSIRSDQFYGQPLATAVREILQMRKARNQGAATVGEIFSALRDGGFAFETKNDDNAKRALRISITKNTALFHKLPNAKIGLLEWYPAAKNRKKSSGAQESAPTDDEQDGEEVEEMGDSE